MPTKEQEKKALAKIEKILEELGNNPDTSYICRAFQGCIEDARENIENDFANSQKDRADYLEKQVENLRREKAELIDAFEAARVQALDRETRDQIGNFLRYEADQAKNEARRASLEMLDACENPESDDYKRALMKAQSNKRRAARLEEMLKKL